MSVGFPTLEHATYSCPCEKHGSQCCLAVRETFPRKDETVWEGRRRYINTGASNTDTHVTLSVGSTVLPSLWRNISLERRERLERWKNVLSVDRKRKKDGRRLDRFYVIICINAMQLRVQFISHFLSVSSGFHFHTHAFYSLLRVFIAQTTAVGDVTPARVASRILRSTGALWGRQSCTAHESVPALDTIGRRGGKGEILWAHTYPTVSSRPRGRCLQSLVPIGSEMWICIRYKQTYKHSSLYILYIYIYE
jgi:hypothetical protein